MKHRVGAILGDAPLLFIGLVIAIAVVFRIGIGAVKTASAEPEQGFVPSVQVHTPIPAESAPAEPAVATTASEPKPVLPRKKPRTHGKR